ncbi:glutaredoxin domain-containing protein [Pelomicrobium sp.]|uniref:glutaredoxin domain-containing protein n=1 Tax=Pelomicrobium sp. TaxID=2815319 RepID=UPI002FDEE568
MATEPRRPDGELWPGAPHPPAPAGSRWHEGRGICGWVDLHHDRAGLHNTRLLALGLTSCLRTKEFLTRNGVSFASRNVLEDESALQELASLGLRQVPIVARGEKWADGQILQDVARLAGIPYGNTQMLPVKALCRRLDVILGAALRFLAQFPQNMPPGSALGRLTHFMGLSGSHRHSFTAR